MDLQSVDSVSLQGEMIQPPRRFSAGSEGISLVNTLYDASVMKAKDAYVYKLRQMSCQ